MYLGATTWTFSWGPPYDEALKTVARLGFKGAELTIWSEEFLQEYYTPQTNQYLRTLIDDLGLTLTDVFCIPVGIGSTDPKKRSEAVEQFKRVLDAAQQLGTDKVIALPPNPFDIDIPVLLGKATAQEWSVEFPKGVDWRQNWRDMIEVMEQFGQACEEREMRVALEPHPHRMMHNAAGMLRILDQVDSKAIGLNLDPSHLFPMGELPNMVAYEVGEHIFHTHISDNDGQTNAHWRPGKGKVDWRAFLIALQEIGYNGPLSLELEDVPGAAGYPGFNRSPDSTPEIEQQHLLAKDYLTRLCNEVGVDLES
ncbi:sugar phosphate isomerase/epimerase [Chloroflexi bacterium TSY]|nr:sugar phosphate isomerase/epimerase [Chloroflexi bacterium TSY]